MMKFDTFNARLREFVFPAGCAVCGKPLLDGSECLSGICSDCADLLKPEVGVRCVRCGRPLISERGTCAECRTKEAPTFDCARALFRYGGPARSLLTAYKFGSGRAAAVFIADLFLGELGFFVFESSYAVVPVPPRPGKIKKKGWDQIELLSRRIERAGIPVSRCLRRLASRSQKELDRRGRATNLAGKIICAAAPPKTAVLIDDVITTGATLDACARSLKDAGAEKVYALAFCYD